MTQKVPMKRTGFLALVILVGTSIAGAQPRGDLPEQEEIGGLPMKPLRAGRFELTPIVSVQYSGGRVAVNVGASFGFQISPAHELGGTFIYGNTLRQGEASQARDRVLRRRIEEVTGNSSTQILAGAGIPGGTGLPSERSWGASLTGLYRYNLPVDRRSVRPFLQVFGGRDFRNGFDYGEIGAGIGARRAVSQRTAVTAQYGYSVLFLDGKTWRRSSASIGVSVFVGRQRAERRRGSLPPEKETEKRGCKPSPVLRSTFPVRVNGAPIGSLWEA